MEWVLPLVSDVPATPTMCLGEVVREVEQAGMAEEEKGERYCWNWGAELERRGGAGRRAAAVAVAVELESGGLGVPCLGVTA